MTIDWSNVYNDKPSYVALMVLICFPLVRQVAEGTSYGAVPFHAPEAAGLRLGPSRRGQPVSGDFVVDLTLNAQLATHFRVYFLYARCDSPGRIWAHFISLFFKAIFLFALAEVYSDKPRYVALMVLICFSFRSSVEFQVAF